jgi:hypothetical protein
MMPPLQVVLQALQFMVFYLAVIKLYVICTVDLSSLTMYNIRTLANSNDSEEKNVYKIEKRLTRTRMVTKYYADKNGDHA